MCLVLKTKAFRDVGAVYCADLEPFIIITHFVILCEPAVFIIYQFKILQITSNISPNSEVLWF